MKLLKATIYDLADILELQKSAFRSVAEILNNSKIQPLVQTYNEILSEFNQGTFLKCVSENDGVICGSVRAYLDDDGTCHVGKLIVAENMRRKGIGKILIFEIEKYFPNCKNFALFTGEITPYTRRLYESAGYKVVSEKNTDDVKMLFMEKPNKS